MRLFTWSRALLLTTAILTGCAESEPLVESTDEAALTQGRVTKLSSAAGEAARKAFDAAVKAGGPELYGYAASFEWNTEMDIRSGLTEPQLAFLANRLIHEVNDVPDRIPDAVELGAVDVSDTSAIATETLRLSGRGADDVTAALAGARDAGLRIARYVPAREAPGASPTAGAILMVDVERREALILYGCRGAAPANVECTVEEMHDHGQFEDTLSRDEWRLVDASEVPLVGDVAMWIGGNGEYSNAEAAAEGHGYRVTATRTGGAVEFVAKGDAWGLMAKIVVEGATGTVSGDADGNSRWNKAATLSCKGL